MTASSAEGMYELVDVLGESLTLLLSGLPVDAIIEIVEASVKVRLKNFEVLLAYNGTSRKRKDEHQNS